MVGMVRKYQLRTAPSEVQQMIVGDGNIHFWTTFRSESQSWANVMSKLNTNGIEMYQQTTLGSAKK